MIWFWPIITIFLFYFFALLQSSFFIYFNLFGAIPNLIFTLFFILVFFSKKDSYYITIFYAILAGLFLDIFSVSQLGISIILLMIIGVLIKKMQSSLNEKPDNYPFVYFLSLFLVSFLAYCLMLKASLYFLNPGFAVITLNYKFLAEIIYSLFFAVIGFYIGKKFIKQNTKNVW